MYTSFERSVNARKQLRDRYGKWMFMGGGVKWFDGVKNILGKIVEIKGDYIVAEHTDASGAVHRTKVHRTDATSVTVKADLDNTPDAAENAPDDTSKATMPNGDEYTDISTWNKTGTQKGSNEGGEYTDPDSGEKYYVKFPQSADHARNEVLASRLYDLVGVPTPSSEMVYDPQTKRVGVATPIIPGVKGTLKEHLDDQPYITEIRKGFAADAWLANWDVAGLVFDNVVTDENGKPVRVDPGGALLFRAQGAPKGQAFGDFANEWDTLRTSPQGKYIFGTLTPDEEKNSVSVLLSATDAEIDRVVDSVGFDDATAASLKTRLKARRENIFGRSGFDKNDPSLAAVEITEDVTPQMKTSPFTILEDTGDNGDGHHSSGSWGKYGASGVLIAAPDDLEEDTITYLLVQRGTGVSSNQGKWQLPGGALNSKENAYQAAARETNEELGIDADYLSTLEPKGEVIFKNDKGWQYTNIAAIAPEQTVVDVDGTETSAADWFTADQILDMKNKGMLHPSLASHVADILALFDTPNEDAKVIHDPQANAPLPADQEPLADWEKELLQGVEDDWAAKQQADAQAEQMSEANPEEPQTFDAAAYEAQSILKSGDVFAYSWEMPDGTVVAVDGASEDNTVVLYDPEGVKLGMWARRDVFADNFPEVLENAAFGGAPSDDFEGTPNKPELKVGAVLDNYTEEDYARLPVGTVLTQTTPWGGTFSFKKTENNDVINPWAMVHAGTVDLVSAEGFTNNKGMASEAAKDGVFTVTKLPGEDSALPVSVDPEPEPEPEPTAPFAPTAGRVVNNSVEAYDSLPIGTIIRQEGAYGDVYMFEKTSRENWGLLDIHTKNIVNPTYATNQSLVHEAETDGSFEIVSSPDDDIDVQTEENALDLVALPAGAQLRLQGAPEENIFIKQADGTFQASWLDDSNPAKTITPEFLQQFAIISGQEFETIDGPEQPQAMPDAAPAVPTARTEEDFAALPVGTLMHSVETDLDAALDDFSMLKIADNKWTVRYPSGGLGVGVWTDKQLEDNISGSGTTYNVVGTTDVPASEPDSTPTEYNYLDKIYGSGDVFEALPIGSVIKVSDSALPQPPAIEDMGAHWRKTADNEWTVYNGTHADAVVPTQTSEEMAFLTDEKFPFFYYTQVTDTPSETNSLKVGDTLKTLDDFVNAPIGTRIFLDEEFWKDDGTPLDFYREKTGPNAWSYFTPDEDGTYFANGKSVDNSLIAEMAAGTSLTYHVVAVSEPTDTPSLAPVDPETGIGVDADGMQYVIGADGNALKVGDIVKGNKGVGTVELIQKGGKSLKVTTPEGDTKFWQVHLLSKGQDSDLPQADIKYQVFTDQNGNEYVKDMDDKPVYVGDTVTSTGAKGFTGVVTGIKPNGQFVLVLDPADNKVKPRRVNKIQRVGESAQPEPIEAPTTPDVIGVPTVGRKFVLNSENVDSLPVGAVIHSTNSDSKGYIKHTDGKWAYYNASYDSVVADSSMLSKAPGNYTASDFEAGSLHTEWYYNKQLDVTSAPAPQPTGTQVGNEFVPSPEILDALPVGAVVKASDSSYLYESGWVKHTDGKWSYYGVLNMPHLKKNAQKLNDAGDKYSSDLSLGQFTSLTYTQNVGIPTPAPSTAASAAKVGDRFAPTKDSLHALPVGAVVKSTNGLIVDSGWVKHTDGNWKYYATGSMKVLKENPGTKLTDPGAVSSDDLGDGVAQVIYSQQIAVDSSTSAPSAPQTADKNLAAPGYQPGDTVPIPDVYSLPTGTKIVTSDGTTYTKGIYGGWNDNSSGAHFSNEKHFEALLNNKHNGDPVHIWGPNDEVAATVPAGTQVLASKNEKNIEVGTIVSHPLKGGSGPVTKVDYETGDVWFTDSADGKSKRYKGRFLNVDESQSDTELPKDPTSPWFEQPEPVKPVAPEILTQKFLPDSWLDEAKQTYAVTKNGKALTTSSYWPIVEGLIVQGDTSKPMQAKPGETGDRFDFLAKRGFITEEMAVSGRQMIADLKAQQRGIQAKYIDDLNEYNANLLSWKVANGLPLSKFSGATYKLKGISTDDVFKSESEGKAWADKNLPTAVGLLTPQEIGAVQTWTSVGGNNGHHIPVHWTHFNTVLREKKEAGLADISVFSDAQVRKMAELLDSAIAKSVVPEDFVVVRSGSSQNFVDHNGNELTDVSQLHGLIGSVVTDFGVVASSASNTPGYGGSGKDMLLHLKVPADSTALWLDGKNSKDHAGKDGLGREMEVLLPRGSRMYIHKVVKEGGYYGTTKVYAEVVPSDWVPPVGVTTDPTVATPGNISVAAPEVAPTPSI